MASLQERLKLKRAPSDIWSVREQLCLASSVLKSGDQNWMSVSRSLKPIADKESVRPTDWFSQKSCAQQYAYLLENADIPKRKKRESGETTSESIVRRLTQDRIAELTKLLNSQREEYQQLKNELSLLKNGTISEDKLQKMWLAIEQDEKEQEQKNKTQIAWLTKRQQSKESHPQQTIQNVQNVQKKVGDTAMEVSSEITEIPTSEDEEKKNKSGRSSLLTSLLKSPSPTTQMQASNSAAGSPTIASLLCSSPKVTGSVMMQNISPQLHQLVSNTTTNQTQERPSASAPTLSMLLEQPSAGPQRVLQQHLQHTTNLINSKTLQSSIPIQNTIQTRSGRLVQGNNAHITQVQQVIATSDLANSEISQIMSNPIDEVMPKVIQMDKDEINEIIGDIEELIKEEITRSPQTLDPTPRTVDIIENLNIEPSPTILPERSEPRNVDEPVSLSNSPTSEISIEEIDSSTSNIAEIIGTAIGTVEAKVNIPETPKKTEEIEEPKFTNESGNKETIETITLKESEIEDDVIQDISKDLDNTPDDKEKHINLPKEDEIVNEEMDKECHKEGEELTCNIIKEQEEKTEEIQITDNTIENKDIVEEEQLVPTPEVVTISPDKTTDSTKQDEKNEQIQDVQELEENDNVPIDISEEEKKASEDDTSKKSIEDIKASSEAEMESSKNGSENAEEPVKDGEIIKKSEVMEEETISDYINKDDSKEVDKDFATKNEDKNVIEIELKESTDSTGSNKDKLVNSKALEKDSKVSNEDDDVKNVKLEETVKCEEIKESESTDEIKSETKKEDSEEVEECKQQKEEIKKDIENDAVKKESVESVGSTEELDEEEPTMSKLSAGRAMKTYSKKQNATVDSEPENETGGETADHRAWKKSIMLVHSRLATHKYASIFLRPITDDQAPGYHSIIFRPMDLLTIKKNIDNGTIRSTTHFQRDVMLMFQNAIMFNKHNTLVHKMTLEMQEDCLQHMQVLVRAAGEASFRRETRTAASNSNEAADISMKRKWTHISSSPHEVESSRTKKRRKSEND